MTFTATLTISHSDLVLAPTLESVSDGRVKREFRAGADSERRYACYTVYADEFRSFEAALEGDHTVVDWTTLTTAAERRLYRVRVAADVLPIEAELASIGVVVDDATGAEGTWEYVVRLPDRETLSAIQSYCEDRGVAFQVHHLATAEFDDDRAGAGILTEAQREALITAYRRGYFDEPRETSLEELATELGISSTAVGGRLRRGTGELVDTVLLSRTDELPDI